MKAILTPFASMILVFFTLLSIEVKAYSDSVLGGITINTIASKEKATYSINIDTHLKTQLLYYDPTGTLDTIQDFIAYGWSYDPDVPSQSIEVHFYVDGTNEQGTLAGSAITDILREDVNQTFGITGNHGFRWFIPQPFRDGQLHELYVYGIDTSNPSINILLNGAPKEFLISSPPSIQCNGEPYNVGAWYFTGWSPTNSFVIGNTELVYGRQNDWWGGVRDHALGNDPWGLHVDYSSREPLLGFYNLLDQNIMDTHILQASSRGVSFFAFYWYWNSDTNQEDEVSAPLQTFISSSLKNYMKFLIAPIKLGNAPMTLNMWQNSVVPFIMENYLSDSAYLKTVDDRPVLIFFDSYFLDSIDDWPIAISFLRNYVIGQTGKNPVILWLYQEGQSSYDLEYVFNMMNVDGFAGFQLGPIIPAEPYEQTLSRWSSFTSERHGFFHFACASTGFDRRPWWQIGWGYPGEGVNDRPYNTGISLQLFTEHLYVVKEYLDEHPIETSKTLIIYAWNEWGEGGIIEPSVVHQYEYLDTIKSVFGLSSVNEVENDQLIIPPDFSLSQNYPNPFNSETIISFSLPKDCKVELPIYNIKGQLVKMLISHKLGAGKHSIIWNGTDKNGNPVSSGVYFYKIETDNYSKTKKAILLK